MSNYITLKDYCKINQTKNIEKFVSLTGSVRVTNCNSGCNCQSGEGKLLN